MKEMNAPGPARKTLGLARILPFRPDEQTGDPGAFFCCMETSL